MIIQIFKFLAFVLLREPSIQHIRVSSPYRRLRVSTLFAPRVEPIVVSESRVNPTPVGPLAVHSGSRMFSQKQLNTFGEALNRKRISQQTFDEAVRENVEEFEMGADEARESAIAEFESQGVDLTGIFTGSELHSHAVYTLSSDVKAHIEAGDVRSLGQSIKSLRNEVDAGKDESSIAVLLAAEIVTVFEPGVILLSSSSSSPTPSSSEAADTWTSTVAIFEDFLRVYAKILLLSNTLREAFLRHMDARNAKAIPLAHENVQVCCAALTVAGSLASQHEAGKAVIMSFDPHEHIVRVLESTRGPIETDDAEFRRGVEAATALIAPLASADDASQPSSSAFSNARKLAQSGVSLALVDSLRAIWGGLSRVNGSDMDDATCRLCMGLKLLAANDEICKDMVVDMKLLDLLFVILKASLGAMADTPARPQLMASAMGLLRQMMASDHVKHSIDITGFIGIASSNLQMYADETYPASSDPGNKVLEHTLGTVSALCLRNPEASEAVVDSGCAQLVVSAMQIIVDRTTQDGKGESQGAPGQGTGRVLRQGCMAVRNIASRSPHVREVLRSYSAVEVIENAKAVARSACGDVGDAAIRDVTNVADLASASGGEDAGRFQYM